MCSDKDPAARNLNAPPAQTLPENQSAPRSFKPPPRLTIPAVPKQGKDVPIGSLPQRLLHLPTMTSLTWRRDNIYGNKKGDEYEVSKYSALSYTWGRFKLVDIDGIDSKFPSINGMLVSIQGQLVSIDGKLVGIDGELFSIDAKLFGIDDKLFHIKGISCELDGKPDGKYICSDCLHIVGGDLQAIQIHEVDWPIPRICPGHFTVDNFQQVINRIGEIDGIGDTDVFLWLDIACIDQRKNSHDGRVEIGRQGTIFKGATKTYVWISAVALEYWELLHVEAHGDIYWDHIHLVEKIIKDPWFTSLWTLQEAYLSFEGNGKSHILSGVGEELIRMSEYQLSLDPIRRMCAWLSGILVAPANLEGLGEEEKAGVGPRIQMLDETGISEIASGNPLLLYSAATNRRPTNKLDEIYGIQQIFGCQLGNTAPGEEGKDFAIDVLEDQFGVRLLQDYPLASQMHYFNTAQDPGRGWHINQSSRMPRFGTGWDSFQAIFHAKGHHQMLCEHIGSARVGDHITGHFSGSLCRVDDFLKAIFHDESVELFVALDCRKLDDNTGSSQSPFVHRVRFEELYGVEGARSQFRSDLEDLVKELMKTRYLDTEILKLGKIKVGDARSSLRSGDKRLKEDRSYKYENLISGLILEKQASNHWRRLGICCWKLYGESEDLEDFGRVEWTDEEGYFG